MHHSDFIVVEKRLAKAQKELADETKRREGLERRCDELFGWVAARDRRIAELEAENERLRAAIEKAPHVHDCCRLWSDKPCNCWKRAALAGKEQG